MVDINHPNKTKSFYKRKQESRNVGSSFIDSSKCVAFLSQITRTVLMFFACYLLYSITVEGTDIVMDLCFGVTLSEVFISILVKALLSLPSSVVEHMYIIIKFFGLVPQAALCLVIKDILALRSKKSTTVEKQSKKLGNPLKTYKPSKNFLKSHTQQSISSSSEEDEIFYRRPKFRSSRRRKQTSYFINSIFTTVVLKFQQFKQFLNGFLAVAYNKLSTRELYNLLQVAPITRYYGEQLTNNEEAEVFARHNPHRYEMDLIEDNVSLSSHITTDSTEQEKMKAHIPLCSGDCNNLESLSDRNYSSVDETSSEAPKDSSTCGTKTPFEGTSSSICSDFSETEYDERDGHDQYSLNNLYVKKSEYHNKIHSSRLFVNETRSSNHTPMNTMNSINQRFQKTGQHCTQSQHYHPHSAGDVSYRCKNDVTRSNASKSMRPRDIQAVMEETQRRGFARYYFRPVKH